MASPVEAQVILCDAAVSDPGTGKVHMLGAGWSTIGSPVPPHAIAVFMKIPWDRANTPLPLKLQLYTGDGHAVQLDSPNGEVDIKGEATIEVGRPPGLAVGSMLDASFVLNVGPLPLQPGRYEWRLAFGELDLPASFTVR